jgi:hypothetical protein
MGGKHKKCQEDGCFLIASFGFNKIIGHKEEGMINLLCKLCNCGKARASVVDARIPFCFFAQLLYHPPTIILGWVLISVNCVKQKI